MVLTIIVVLVLVGILFYTVAVAALAVLLPVAIFGALWAMITFAAPERWRIIIGAIGLFLVIVYFASGVWVGPYCAISTTLLPSSSNSPQDRCERVIRE